MSYIDTDSEPDFLYKIVLIGDSGVGKTNILTRFARGLYFPNSTSTIGVEFATKTMQVGGMRIQAQIWDTCGQDRFMCSFVNAVCAMICFDISCIETFEHVPKWLEELRSKSENVCIFLVGTKKDKVHLREVEQRQALRFCELNDLAGYVETSAKENSNIDLVFESLVAERFKADHQTISLDKVDNIAQPRVPSFSTKGVVDLKGVLIPTEGEELRTRNGCAC